MQEELRIQEVLQRLAAEHGGKTIALQFQNPLQLLIATILAAQCTDERVNAVTVRLFQKYPSADSFARANLAELEQDIRPTGFFHNKARAITGCCREIVESFGGKVPSHPEDLVRLPGVGRKTANIVLGNAFGQQAIAVDTHVFRVSHRLGLAFASNPDKVEEELAAIIPRQHWTEATHWLVWHGRTICQAKKPLCASCVVYDLCPWEGKPRKAVERQTGKKG
jgi:endonuclease-3